MQLNKFRYFKLFILVLTVIFISTSCQPPNLINNKIESKNDKKFSIKDLKPLDINLRFVDGIDIEKRSFSAEDYNTQKAIGPSYYRDWLGNAYALGDTTSVYLLFSFSKNYQLPEGSFGLQRLSHAFAISGDATIKSREEGKYVYTIDLYNKGWAE
ncbi:MAG: hypothetical protein ACK4IX_01110, partial [Candidatus Sericytochromatia bacterium]